MKKINTIIIFSFILLGVSTACKNEPIFAAIEEEVKLKKHTVQGLVSGIVRIGELVYCANPKNVFVKTVGYTGEWTKIDIPNGMCTSLASDNTDLYATFMGLGVYKYQNGSWDFILSSSDIAKIVSGVNIVGVDGSNVVWKLNGAQFEKMQDSANKDIILGSTLQGGGGHYFGDRDSLYSYVTGKGVKLDLPDLKNIKDICEGDGAQNVLVLTTSSLFHYDGSSFTSIKHQVLSPWSLSYSKQKKLALIGGLQGYKEVQFASSASLVDSYVIVPGSEGSTTPPSCYNQYNNSVGKWLLRPILIIDIPDGYIIYVGVGGADPKYTGLWGFYEKSQHEWNRE